MSGTCPTCGMTTWTGEELARRCADQVKKVNAVQAKIRAACPPVRVWRLGRFSLIYRPCR